MHSPKNKNEKELRHVFVFPFLAQGGLSSFLDVMFRALTFLGTSSGTPTAYRNVSSYCLSLSDGAVWLVDAGEGTQHQLIKCGTVSRGRIDKIFITHLHGDHSYGLPGLLCSIGLTWSPPGVVSGLPPRAGKSLAAASETPSLAAALDSDDDEEFDAPRIYDHFSQRSQYLELVGPEGLAELLRSVLIASEARFGFQYRVTELVVPPSAKSEEVPVKRLSVKTTMSNALKQLRHPDEVDPVRVDPDEHGMYTVPLCGAAGVLVRAAPLHHRVFCLGYVATEAPLAGALRMDLVKALGVPTGPLLSKLKAGETVSFTRSADGSAVTVCPDDVVGPPQPGRTVVLLGDTCDSTSIAALLRRYSVDSPDWVVHESTFDGNNEALAIPRGHSTAKMAGQFAQSVSAKNLVLTHFSARFPSSAKDPQLMESIRSEAERECATARTQVHVADDFSVFDLERRKKSLK